MTPSMRLSDIVRRYKDHIHRKGIIDDLNEAFSLGHEFGLARAAEAVDDFAYRQGDAARHIRTLKVERVKDVRTTSEDFL